MKWCGIKPVLGKSNVVARPVEGLERLEYRGYDSASRCVTSRIRRSKPENIPISTSSITRDAPFAPPPVNHAEPLMQSKIPAALCRSCTRKPAGAGSAAFEGVSLASPTRTTFCRSSAPGFPHTASCEFRVKRQHKIPEPGPCLQQFFRELITSPMRAWFQR